MTALIFFLVLSFLVLAHELGHYLAARAFGIKSHEFGIGLPPRIIGLIKEGNKWKLIGRKDEKNYKRTILSFNYLPFGGFVRIKGEDASESKDSDSILSKPLWQRMIVIFAGVFMNWVMAATLLSIVLMIGVSSDLDGAPKSARISDRTVSVADVLPGSPADKGGLVVGDVIISVNGESSDTATAIHGKIRESAAAGSVLVEFTHKGESKTANLTPVVLSEINAPGIGIALGDVGKVSFSPPAAVVQGVLLTGRMTKNIFFALGGMVRDLVVKQHVTADVAGPVGIALMTGVAARDGITTLLQFAAMLSINLAVINILPIPALDGGRLFFMILERVRRREMNRMLETRIHTIAYIALLLLILVVSVRDVGKYSSEIVGGLKNLIGM